MTLPAVRALVVFALLAGACSGGPGDAYRRFARALERQDHDEAYRYLDPASRQRLQRAAKRLERMTDGAWAPGPADLIRGARTPRVVRLSVVAEDRGGALLKVLDTDGGQHSVEMIRRAETSTQGGPAWMVVLAPVETAPVTTPQPGAPAEEPL